MAQKNVGLKWRAVQSPLYSNIKDLYIFQDNSGIALADKILILENGTWKILENQPEGNPFVIFALSKESIYAAYPDIYHNSALYYFNGKKWNLQPTFFANVIRGINFLDEDFGLFIGFEEAVLQKGNQKKQLSPVSPYRENSFFILKDSTIWLHEYDSTIVKFDGIAWRNIASDKKIDLIAASEEEVFCLRDSFLYQIIDDTLSLHSTFHELMNISSISVLSNQKMFACGKEGLILEFENNKWRVQKSPVKQNLIKIKMISSTEGWCVGEDGTILEYGTEEREFVDSWKGFNNIKIYGESKVIDDEYAVVVADFNADGLPDIFTCGLFEINHLYLNKGANYFFDSAVERGVSGKNENESILENLKLGACAADFDNDGTIDLYVTKLNRKNAYYRNLGNAYFVDYSEFSGGLGEGNDRSNSAIAGDVDNDGDLDLFITNENTTNRLFENNGAGKFTEITKNANLVSKPGGTGASFGDIDGDGDLDLFVTNWAAKNKLYKNMLAETGKLRFINFSDSAKIFDEEYTKSNGVVFADIDNDSDLDLFITNRKFSNKLFLNDGKGIFEDKTEELIGEDSLLSYGAVIADFNGDGWKDIFLSNVGKSILYLQEDGKFVDRTLKYSATVEGYGTGTACADFNGDGDIDVYCANYIGSGGRFLINKSADNNFLKIKLEGEKNNKEAIGAKIFVYDKNRLNDKSKLFYFAEINGGSGYVSMNETVQTISLGKRKYVDVKVIFPDGTEIVRSAVSKNSFVTITDVEGFNAVLAKFENSFLRLFLDAHRFTQLLKWILVFLILGVSSLLGNKKYRWSKLFIFAQIVVFTAAYAFLSSIYEYDSFYLSTLLPISTVVIGLLILHLFFELVILKNESLLERERIRTKLSRDLHDDLASTLGSVGIYVELLKNSFKKERNNAEEYLTKLENLIGSSKQSITDLIWTIKPTPELISNFTGRLKENYSEVLRARNISFEIIVSKKDNSIKLDSIVKHNVFLIIKEAVNNAIKHAEAEKITIKIWRENKELNFSIYDDGRGFNTEDSLGKGNGLKNMKLRAEEIGGELKILSNAERTEIKLKIK